MPSDPSEADLLSLAPPFRAAMLSMYRQEPQLGADGQMHPIDRQTRISPAAGLWLYQLCLAQRPVDTIEIGMAYGYSMLYFLAAQAQHGGRHTAIDPFQHAAWQGVGLTHAQRLAPGKGTFRFINERSDRAAVDLVRANESFGVIFIDGNHRFDDALVDFYLYASLCAPGGHIVFDDTWMGSIQTVAAFVRSNRDDFAEIHGAPGLFVFRKVGEDTRNWRHFNKFS